MENLVQNMIETRMGILSTLQYFNYIDDGG